jgi:hypothetical protein
MAGFIFKPFSLIATPASAIATSGTGSASLQTDTDADIEVHGVLVSTNRDSGAVPNNVSVRITDKSGSYLWSNDFVPQAAYGGQANGFVFQEGRPFIIPKGSTLLFEFTNLSGSQTVLPSVVLKGYKVYPT